MIIRVIFFSLYLYWGEIQCALFGNYVDVVKELVASNGYRMAVVILQFVKVKTFKGQLRLILLYYYKFIGDQIVYGEFANCQFFFQVMLYFKML